MWQVVGQVTHINGKKIGRNLSETISWQVGMNRQVLKDGDHSKHCQLSRYVSHLLLDAQLLRRADIKVTVLRVDYVVVCLVRAGKMLK